MYKPFRSSFGSVLWRGRRRHFVIPISVYAMLLLLVYLGNMSYIYGSVFQSTSRVHALKVLAVDYDGAAVGESLQAAYSSLQGNNFPTLEYHSALEYPIPQSLAEAVCKQDYWAAIYTHAGATDRLVRALLGGSPTAYNASDAISYIYTGAYYPVIAHSLVAPNMEMLISVASRVLYPSDKGLLSLAHLADLGKPTSASAVFGPISPSSMDLFPTNQDTRVFLNTVSIIMPVLIQFFFSMALNSISAEQGVLARLAKRDVYVFRLIVSKLFMLACGLVSAGYIFAYREGRDIAGAKLFGMSMCLWLFMEISYLVIDTVLVTVIPLPFMPFFILTWVIASMASTVTPFELSPGFYSWAYALPAHNIWILLMEIWSGGCKPQNEVAVPMLLGWWLVGHLTSAWSVWRRCAMAELAEEEEHANMATRPSRVSLEKQKRQSGDSDVTIWRGSESYTG